jgi:hypothetical protein
MSNIRSDDRVLCLTMPSLREIAAIGRILSSGCLVAIGTRDEVDEARRTLSEFDNLMFVESAGGSIPWRDAFFTKILAPPRMREAFGTELQRVLAPGGEIVSTAENA